MSSRGRTLLFAIVASQVLTLIASSQRYWPFGFVRTNYYLIPLLMLLAGIGGVRDSARLWASACSGDCRGRGRSDPVPAAPRRSRPAGRG